MSFTSMGSVSSLHIGTGFDPLEGLTEDELANLRPLQGAGMVALPTLATFDLSLGGSAQQVGQVQFGFCRQIYAVWPGHIGRATAALICPACLPPPPLPTCRPPLLTYCPIHNPPTYPPDHPHPLPLTRTCLLSSSIPKPFCNGPFIAECHWGRLVPP